MYKFLYYTYNGVNLSGSANGKITHDFGINSFNVTLEDAGQSVTFSANSTSNSTSGKNGLTSSVKTKSKYMTHNGGARAVN